MSIDNLYSGRYTRKAAAKSVAGIGVPDINSAPSRAFAVFLWAMHSYTQSMVGRAGASKDAPGSLLTGYANPARLTTNEIGVSRGEFSILNSEAAIMATIPAIAHPEITVINGQAVTSSLAIADFFTKRHERVLDKIRNLECSPTFAEHNFVLSEYTDTSGRKLPCYQITRDGFAFLAMGFTGKRAAQFKESYITAFNQMEKQIYNAAGPSASDAQRAQVVYLYLTEINRVWKGQLYPMLVAAQSPLAHSLHDYINDGAFAAALLNASMNRVAKEVV
ncbi:Rha family transcriptional regulator [Edwardsiella piscicida]